MGDDEAKEYDGGWHTSVGGTTADAKGCDDTIERSVVAFHVVLQHELKVGVLPWWHGMMI